ncbi:hypothetical protein QP933_06945 [Corynebacterium pseudodiphtheriticum]|uniref:hypothetical protein n=1 Tax=Corynebacterium pseudodiphtheriticum TaxID=37637 RepID=UPI00206345ED|nr:hypothetical protein [Corynebacterium pseudodiphtheriticum]MDK8500676.1 hypothetical protein [Corynebacterium pseudodiphtheriticum]MDK8775764.1 hypothetical protein [Corynebacterium pseudodiphtheriticum]DAM65387.1 MAG TPA: hypothetical protein [Caudoviricetes sp.]
MSDAHTTYFNAMREALKAATKQREHLLAALNAAQRPDGVKWAQKCILQADDAINAVDDHVDKAWNALEQLTRD